MYTFVGFLIITSIVSGSVPRILGGKEAENGSVPRVVGGNEAEAKYPYQASIRIRGSHVCGASIISPYVILTAARCIYKKVPSQMTVVVGTNYLSQPGIVHTVNKLIWHEFYNECLVRNDIGLILVNGYIKYNDKIQPIPLARVYYVPQETNAVVTGWRKLNNGSDGMSNALQALNVTIVSQEMCQLYDWMATKNNICTSAKRNQACSGDPGSPLVFNGTQVGIVSYGRSCDYLSVYTRVFPYEQWINNITSNQHGIGSQVNSNMWSILLLAVSIIVFSL
ncbi:chymotrypsin-1-like [Bombus terrestris]|uniref:Chymotrypsin-1-like n=1 Tax=Bombus terrestris TaxID=30195 RepID=A0A9B0BL22_BOMTE|nr:chymotrypsin-1-like [Bombus terrestris]